MEEQASGATVSLDADVNPFEQGLAKANGIVAGWTAKVESKFASMAATVAAKSELLVSSLASFADKGGAEIGGTLGSKIGLAAGTAIGGPVGAFIGSKLGEIGGKELAKMIDFETITQSLNELAQGIQPITDKLKGNWSDFRSDAAGAFDKVRELARGLDIKGLLKGDGGAWDDFERRGSEAWALISEQGDRAAFRFQETIDTAWQTLQDPLAKVADWIQIVLKNLGFVDASTASWGDSLRQVQDVGQQALGALGYGLGYLEGLFKKAAGYALEYFGLPLQAMFASVLEGLSTLITGLNQLAEDAGLGKLEWVDRVSKKIDGLGEKLKENLGATLVKAQELQNINLTDRAEQRQKEAQAAGVRGKDIVTKERDDREFEKYLEEWLNEPLEQAAENAVKIDETMRSTASALIDGSREAVNTVVRLKTEQAARAAAGGQADPAAAAAMNTARNTSETVAVLNRVASILEDRERFDVI